VVPQGRRNARFVHAHFLAINPKDRRACGLSSPLRFEGFTAADHAFGLVLVSRVGMRSPKVRAKIDPNAIYDEEDLMIARCRPSFTK
jgi:hypothetical protein